MPYTLQLCMCCFCVQSSPCCYVEVFAIPQVVLENSCRSDDHDLPFAQASIALTNTLCEILKVGEPRKLLRFMMYIT